MYLTYLAYKSGGMAAVENAKTALNYYTGLQGIKGRYMKDELIVLVVKGLERDFAKPIQQREGFSPEEMKKIIQYFLREMIAKLVNLRMACLLLFLYISAGIFEEAAGIELENVQVLESGNIRVYLLKRKKNQLAKRQVVILSKLESSNCPDLDITTLMRRYIERLEDQESKAKFLFPSCQCKMAGKGERSSSPLNKSISYDTARRSLLAAVRATKIKKEADNFGLHSCPVGALTEAANSGKFSQLQLQNLGRWAQMDSAARYFLPREKEQAKVGKELGSRLVKSLEHTTAGQMLEAGPGNILEAACNLQASRFKASATDEKWKQEKSSKKRAIGLERQKQKQKQDVVEKQKQKQNVVEKKARQQRLLLRARKTGPGEEDWQALPVRRQ